MNFLQNMINKPLFRVSSLNGISVLIKIAIGLVTSKIIAIFVGPSGMALVGNLRNFLSTIETVSILGFQNGTVKYVAENERDESGLKKIISTVFITLFGLAIVVSTGLFFLSSYLNLKIFGSDNDYGIVFKALAIGLPWYVANFVFVAIINGLGKFTKVIYISILGNIISLIISVTLIWQMSTLGALLSVVISPSLLFLVSCYFINSEIQFLKYVSLQWFNFSILKNLSSYTLMALASGVLGPIVFLAIRNSVIQNLGIAQAGYWEAITRISTYYLLFITTLISVYFLPKLVLAENSNETRGIFFSYYKNVLPIFVAGLLLLFLLRNLVVQLLFTSDFEPVSDLFLWQLIGDFLKAASLILGYQLLAKKLTMVFIVTEIISLTILYLTSIYLVKQFDIEGVVMAYAFTYFVYLIVLMIYFRKEFGLDFKL